MYKEIYVIGENDLLRNKREFVRTKFVINELNCIKLNSHILEK